MARSRALALGGALLGGLLLAVLLLHRSAPVDHGALRAATLAPGVDAVHIFSPGPTPSASQAPATTPAGPVTHTPAPRATAAASWFSATLGAACVVPGGTQSLAVQTRPDYTVAFNSRYPDGQGGNVHGGFGVLGSDAQGRVQTRWTVAAGTPLGTVTVQVGTGDGGASTVLQRSFTVAAHC